jgi:hypothetical protein
MPIARQSARYTVLSAKAANGVGNNVNVSDFQHVIIALASPAASTFTVKVQGALENPVPSSVGVPNVPDFSAAASNTNHWTFVNSFNLDDNSNVAGSTGHAVSAAQMVRTVKVNTSGLDWLNLQVSGLSAGSCSAWLVGYTNG